MDYDALEIMVEQFKGYKLPEDFIFKLNDIEKAMKSFDFNDSYAFIIACGIEVINVLITVLAVSITFKSNCL